MASYNNNYVNYNNNYVNYNNNYINYNNNFVNLHLPIDPIQHCQHFQYSVIDSTTMVSISQ